MLNGNPVFDGVEMQPIYPGGEQQLLKDVANVTIYPSEAMEKGIQGVVVVQFVVKKDGTIGEVKVVRSKHPLLDNAAIKAVRKLKRFDPGLMNGNPVNCWYTVPITFRLSSE